MLKHEDYMRMALEQAKLAAVAGDVPVGALIVRSGRIIARAGNAREQMGLATAHAEILAIEAACRVLGSRRLTDCTMYVSLEPCPMCAGAIVAAGISRLVFGCSDSIWGGAGSIFNIVEHPLAPSRPEVLAGICEEECQSILKEFFRRRRQEPKA